MRGLRLAQNLACIHIDAPVVVKGMRAAPCNEVSVSLTHDPIYVVT
jgi:hypothetical protein